jgi:soluble lytic murein transglycosylase-like protein
VKHRDIARAVLVMFIVVVGFGCGRRESSVQTASTATPTREEIFAAIETRAARYRMEPGFVYALVAAESNFDPRAHNGEACGLLQLTPAAWRAVSSEPFAPAVWDWRANLDAGIDYLAFSRTQLHRKNAFSYPMLLAAFHYGFGYVEDRGFELKRVPVPENEIYRQLWAGNLTPIPLPVSDNKKPAAKTAGE